MCVWMSNVVCTLNQMERDCGIMHGAPEFLRDRLLKSAAPFKAPFCASCGYLAQHVHDENFGASIVGKLPYCKLCKTNDVRIVEIPYAYKLLIQELEAVGIKMRHRVKKADV